MEGANAVGEGVEVAAKTVPYALSIASASAGFISLAINLIAHIVRLILKYALTPSSLPRVKLNTVVRIGIALDNAVFPQNPMSGSGGRPPMVVAFDESNNFLGMSRWNRKQHINNGGYIDLEVHHLEARTTVQATQLQIIGQESPQCIAYITEVWADDTKRAWAGNPGASCEYNWSFSNIIIGKSNGSDFKPFCTWIDGNENNPDIYAKGLQIDMGFFMTSTDDTRKFESRVPFCNPPFMLFMDKHTYKIPRDFIWPGAYPRVKSAEKSDYFVGHHARPQLWKNQYKKHVKDPDQPYAKEIEIFSQVEGGNGTSIKQLAIRGQSQSFSQVEGGNGTSTKQRAIRGQSQSPSSPATARKRDLEKRNEALANVDSHFIITSRDHQHSANLACKHYGYLGPDIVSLHEQYFCDIKTKTLWKLCKSQVGPSAENSIFVDGDDEEGCFHHEELSFVQTGKKHKRNYARREIWELNGDIVRDGIVVNKV